MDVDLGWRRRGCLVALLTTAALVSGCGGSDDTSTSASSRATATSSASSPAGSTSATSSTGSGESPSSTDSATDGGSAQPTAATGTPITMDTITFNTPQGWRVLKSSSQAQDATVYDKFSDNIVVHDTMRFGQETYDDNAKLVPGRAKYLAVKVTRQPDRTVNGVTGYVFTGSGSGAPYYYEFGTVSNNHSVYVALTCQVSGAAGQARAQAAMDSLLASVVWN